MRLVILDQEGTINEEVDGVVDSPDAWKPLPGAIDAIARINHAGWHVVIASNQPGLGRGLIEVDSLNVIQSRMLRLMSASGARADAFFYCPHTPDESCHCRKPEPGLFEQIGERFGIELSGVPAVGDTMDDLLAATAAGCMPHLVLTGAGQACLDAAKLSGLPAGTRVHKDLAAFAEFLMAQTTESR